MCVWACLSTRVLPSALGHDVDPEEQLSGVRFLSMRTQWAQGSAVLHVAASMDANLLWNRCQDLLLLWSALCVSSSAVLELITSIYIVAVQAFMVKHTAWLQNQSFTVGFDNFVRAHHLHDCNGCCFDNLLPIKASIFITFARFVGAGVVWLGWVRVRGCDTGRISSLRGERRLCGSGFVSSWGFVHRM